MLVIRFGVRKDNLKVLNSIVNEAVGYGVTKVKLNLLRFRYQRVSSRFC